MRLFKTIFILSLIANANLTFGLDTIYTKIGVVKAGNPRVDEGYQHYSYFAEIKSEKPRFVIDLSGIWKLEDAAVFQDRLILLTSSSNTYRATIVDIEDGKVIDNFWGAFSKLSPSGRFIVFQLWEGRGIRDKSRLPIGETRIYDVTKSPDENRTKQGKQKLKYNPISDHSDSQDCGLPVFPLGDPNQPDYGWVDRRDKRVSPMTAYSWYDDSAFIFATHQFEKNQPTLVDVAFDTQSQTFKVRTHQLDGKDFQLASDMEAPSLVFGHISKTKSYIELHRSQMILRIPNVFAD